MSSNVEIPHSLFNASNHPDGNCTTGSPLIPVPAMSDQFWPLLLVAITSGISVFTTFSLLFFSIYRTSRRAKYVHPSIEWNIFLVLIGNLLLADHLQSTGFFFNVHWLVSGSVGSRSGLCILQTVLINFGDLANGFFILALGLQTWWHITERERLEKKTTTYIIIGIWVFSFVLSILGPIIRKANYSVDTGAWCWANPEYKVDSLLFHYIWIFAIEMGTICIYGLVFIDLRKKRKSLQDACREFPFFRPRSLDLLKRTCRNTILYPVVYTFLSLPLGICRMHTMNKKSAHVPVWLMALTGCIYTSCGTVDVVLYLCTRRQLFAQVFTRKPSTGASTDSDPASANARNVLRYINLRANFGVHRLFQR